MSAQSRHPDPDSLNAFIEGVLPEHERQECLTHLAVCAECREVVSLAQEPTAVPVVQKASGWKRWFALPAAAAAVIAGIWALSTVAVFRHDQPVVSAPTMVAEAPVMPQAPAVEVAPALPRARPRAAPVLRKEEPVAAPVPVTAPPAPAPAPAIPAPRAEIAGTVTDAAGAVVPSALVEVRPVQGDAVRNASVDQAGQFHVAGLQPGQYQVQVTAPGFQPAKSQVDVPRDQVARVDSELKVGSVAETVQVTAAAPMVQTQSARISKPFAALPAFRRVMPAFALPSKLAAVKTVTQGKVILAADSAGALFVSQDGGEKWKAVKPVWEGKVVGLALAEPAFRLTTDGGTAWLSRDGSHWYSEPSKP